MTIGFNMKTETKKMGYAVQFNKVSKKYIVHHQKPTFSEQLINRYKKEAFYALKNISINILKGEKVGIIGSNGSGKTTFLKLIAGITKPTSGSVEASGKIVSLIDLEAGFHPDLTGYENIFLNGLLTGMKKKEIKDNLKKIVRFADIGNFIDAPLYTYSQGMKLRLGFSIAVHANPDILIIDEGVTVGDQDFYTKAKKKISRFFKAGKTIFVVAHWLEFLEENCDKIIWIDKGTIKEVGGKEVIASYKKQT